MPPYLNGRGGQEGGGERGGENNKTNIHITQLQKYYLSMTCICMKREKRYTTQSCALVVCYFKTIEMNIYSGDD